MSLFSICDPKCILIPGLNRALDKEAVFDAVPLTDSCFNISLCLKPGQVSPLGIADVGGIGHLLFLMSDVFSAFLNW